MTETKPLEDLGLKARDAIILLELTKDPQRSSRELRDILAEEHDIDVSHVTVSESIRTMRENEVFREAVVPHEELSPSSCFRSSLDGELFATIVNLLNYIFIINAWNDAVS